MDVLYSRSPFASSLGASRAIGAFQRLYKRIARAAGDMYRGGLRSVEAVAVVVLLIAALPVVSAAQSNVPPPPPPKTVSSSKPKPPRRERARHEAKSRREPEVAPVEVVPVKDSTPDKPKPAITADVPHETTNGGPGTLRIHALSACQIFVDQSLLAALNQGEDRDIPLPTGTHSVSAISTVNANIQQAYYPAISSGEVTLETVDFSAQLEALRKAQAQASAPSVAAPDQTQELQSQLQNQEEALAKKKEEEEKEFERRKALAAEKEKADALEAKKEEREREDASRLSGIPGTNSTESSVDGSAAGSAYVWVQAGQFLMGCTENDKHCADDETQHQVTLSHGFWFGQTDVTVAQFMKYASARGIQMPDAPSFNPNWSKKAHPMVNVTYDLAQDYCKWAGGRLPTEAEWEDAARAGANDIYIGGVQPDKHAVDFDSKDGTVPALSPPANRWNIYDLEGNVWEWTSDSYQSFQSPPVQDPQVAGGAPYVVRGGSWASPKKEDVRISVRKSSADLGDRTNDSLGFRCVLDHLN
jgi:sulfatase modifying factor 1